jgi:hypothetical protein
VAGSTEHLFTTAEHQHPVHLPDGALIDVVLGQRVVPAAQRCDRHLAQLAFVVDVGHLGADRQVGELARPQRANGPQRTGDLVGVAGVSQVLQEVQHRGVSVAGLDQERVTEPDDTGPPLRRDPPRAVHDGRRRRTQRILTGGQRPPQSSRLVRNHLLPPHRSLATASPRAYG